MDAAQCDRKPGNSRSVALTQVLCPADLPDATGDSSGPVLQFASPEANEREGRAVALKVKVTSPVQDRGICFKLNDRGEGSANEGSDYGFFRSPTTDPTRDPLPEDCVSSNRIDGQVFTVPPGTSEVTVALLCLADDQRIEKAEQAVFTLSPGSGYRLGAPETQTFALTVRDPGK